jgi:hypothetical protein
MQYAVPGAIPPSRHVVTWPKDNSMAGLRVPMARTLKAFMVKSPVYERSRPVIARRIHGRLVNGLPVDS